MSEAIESLEGLLKKLLDRSQLDAGVVRPDISVFELAPLIEQVQRDSEAHAKLKGLALSIRCQSRVFVCSDRTLLLSVLRNLLENSIKYTDRGGAEVTVEQHDGVVKVCVADTGRGIPEHERERVFEEFYQLDNRQRDASRGFGLGLSIVRGYCALLGIKLALASPPGGGTAVELTLAEANPEEFPSTQEVAQVGDPELFRGLRVLITEDDARVLEAECTLLRARGCDVSAARTVAEAKQLVSSDSFDLLVTDYRLPDGSGFDVIHALESVQLDPPAVLFVTGDTGAAELRAMSDSGYECLTKPVKLVPLLRAMNRALIRKENLRAQSPRECS